MKKYRQAKLILFITIFTCIFLLYKILSEQTWQQQQQQPYKTLIYNFFLNLEKSIFNSIINSTSTRNYPKLQANIISRRGSVQSKVVFYKTGEFGYGNRIYSMMSAFMIAVLTDSALLVKWPLIDSYIDFSLPNVFSTFQDRSFLDFKQKSPKICRLNTVSPNTWNREKKLDVFKSK